MKIRLLACDFTRTKLPASDYAGITRCHLERHSKEDRMPAAQQPTPNVPNHYCLNVSALLHISPQLDPKVKLAPEHVDPKDAPKVRAMLQRLWTGLLADDDVAQRFFRQMFGADLAVTLNVQPDDFPYPAIGQEDMDDILGPISERLSAADQAMIEDICEGDWFLLIEHLQSGFRWEFTPVSVVSSTLLSYDPRTGARLGSTP